MTDALRKQAADYLARYAAKVDLSSIPDAGAAIGGAPTATATVISFAYRIGSAKRGEELDLVGRDIYGCGALSEVEIGLLEAARTRRRAEQKAQRQWWQQTYGLPLKPPRDRATAETRRRGLLRMGWLPPAVANGLTPGEEAVAAIYAQDFRRKGFCDDTKAQLAERAGVVERVVQRTQKVLFAGSMIKVTRRPQPGRRHESTIVVITDAAWRLWLRNRRVPDRSPRGVGDCKGDHKVRVPIPRNLKEAKESAEGQQVALQRTLGRMPGARSAPSGAAARGFPTNPYAGRAV